MRCSRCSKEFKAYKKYTDGLCGKCRSRAKYLNNVDKYRKTNSCPTCGKSILKNSKMCNSCSQKGNSNHQWKETKQNRKIYSTSQWKDWSKSIKDRDSRTCQVCGNKGPRLHAHHILPKRYFPFLTFKLFNGITLCSKCHSKVQFKEMNFITKFFGF